MRKTNYQILSGVGNIYKSLIKFAMVGHMETKNMKYLRKYLRQGEEN